MREEERSKWRCGRRTHAGGCHTDKKEKMNRKRKRGKRSKKTKECEKEAAASRNSRDGG